MKNVGIRGSFRDELHVASILYNGTPSPRTSRRWPLLCLLPEYKLRIGVVLDALYLQEAVSGQSSLTTTAKSSIYVF